jgi:hypothetical protein
VIPWSFKLHRTTRCKQPTYPELLQYMESYRIQSGLLKQKALPTFITSSVCCFCALAITSWNPLLLLNNQQARAEPGDIDPVRGRKVEHFVLEGMAKCDTRAGLIAHKQPDNMQPLSPAVKVYRNGFFERKMQQTVDYSHRSKFGSQKPKLRLSAFQKKKIKK